MVRRVFSSEGCADAMVAAGHQAEADNHIDTAEVDRLMDDNDRLRAALKRWPCSSCGGKGKVWPAPWNPKISQVICVICNGDGIHGIARAALDGR